MGYRHHQALFILYCSVPIDCCYHDTSSSSMFTKGEVVVKRKHGELTSFTNNERFNKTQPTSLSLHFSQPHHVILEDFRILYWLWVSQQLGLKVWIASAAAAHTQTTRYPTTFRWGSPHSKPILCSIGHSYNNPRLWYVLTPLWRLFNGCTSRSRRLVPTRRCLREK
jgi:hypothetical protein